MQRNADGRKTKRTRTRCKKQVTNMVVVKFCSENEIEPKWENKKFSSERNIRFHESLRIHPI